MSTPFKLKKKKDFDFGNKGNFNFKKTNKYIDPDAPGVPGKPGYEPPVDYNKPYVKKQVNKLR